MSPLSSESRPSLGGVVLCGGESRRMGRAKAWLPFGQETMLARVVRLLRAVVDPIVLVAAPEQVLPPVAGPVTVLRDEQPLQGPLEGLRVGLAELRTQAEFAYVTSCDVPGLNPEFIRQLARRSAGYEIVVPVEETFAHPLSAVYRTSLSPTIEQLLRQDRRRPIFLFDEVPTCRVPVDELRAVDPDLLTLRNLNTPEDYERARREFDRQGF